MIYIMVAVDQNGVIGKDGRIPWHISGEKKVFKEHTINNTIIMGRKTYETCVKRPLPDRHNIVVSNKLSHIEGANVCTSISEALAKAESFGRDTYVIGGAEIFEQTLAFVDRMHVSYLKKAYDGDTYFPAFNQNDWQKVSEKEYDEFTFVTYKKK